jgi:hypothetical protein
MLFKRYALIIKIIQVEVSFEYQGLDLADPKDLLSSMLQYEADDGTNYNSAIKKAGNLIETHFDHTKYVRLNKLTYCNYSL